MDYEKRTRERLNQAVRQIMAAAPAPKTALQGPLRTIRRRGLIQQAKLLAGRYGLGEHMDALVYAAGAEALTGLDLQQLEQLVGALEHMGAALDTACDSPLSPPAR